MRFEDLADRRVVVWGAGREGVAALAELTGRGIDATVAVTGSGTLPEGVPGASGQDGLEALLTADVVVKSPGIPKTSEEFRRLDAAGVRLTSLSDLWLGVNHARVIGVTGTKGKSTTSMITTRVLAALGWDSRLVGNVGTAVTGVLGEDQVAVMEVSSYQASSLTVSPRVAVVTSLFPEHLPWHGGFEAYRDDKFNLVAHDPEVVVVSDLQPELRERALLVAPRTRLITPAGLGLHVTSESITWEGVGELRADEMHLRGEHNVGNAALALATAKAWCGEELDAAAALASLREVQPLEHRLQVVPSNDGRTWVDDSLATNPQAVEAALRTWPDSPIVLILGGSERDLPFGPLIDFLATRGAPTRVLTIGPAGHRFADEADGRIPHLVKAENFADAMRLARSSDLSDAVVLLSPCAPSFDEFTDYRDRSRAFRDAALA